MRNAVLAVLMAATFLMPAYAQNPFVEEKPDTGKVTPVPAVKKADSNLLQGMLQLTPQVPLPDGTKERSERVSRNWEVKGRIDSNAILVNLKGQSAEEPIGEEFDGCLVTEEKLVCNPDEKILETRKTERAAREKAYKEAVALLERTKKNSVGLSEQLKTVNAELKGRDDEINKLHANIAALETKVKRLEEKLSNREVASKKGLGLPDFAWTEANVEDIGSVMCADAGMAGIIMKVDQTNVKKAEAALKGAIRNKQEQENYAYFTLSKDMLQIEEAR